MFSTNVSSTSNSMLKKRLRVFENISNEGGEEENFKLQKQEKQEENEEGNYARGNFLKLGQEKFSFFSDIPENSKFGQITTQIIPQKISQKIIKNIFNFPLKKIISKKEDENFSQFHLDQLRELDIENSLITSKKSISNFVS